MSFRAKFPASDQRSLTLLSYFSRINMNKEPCDPCVASSSFLSCVPYQIPWSCVAIHVLHTEVIKQGFFLSLSKRAFLKGFFELAFFFVFLCLSEFSSTQTGAEKPSELFRRFVISRNSRNAVGCSVEIPNFHDHPKLYDCKASRPRTN